MAFPPDPFLKGLSVNYEVFVLQYKIYKFSPQLQYSKVGTGDVVSMLYQSVVEAGAVSRHTNNLRVLHKNIHFL